MINSSSDRRRHIRITRDDPVYIKVLACAQAPELDAVTLQCNTLDVSASGIKLLSSVPIPEPGEIEVWVDVSASAQKYFMHGLIKWCYPSDAQQQAFELGVQLLNVPFTDFLAWVSMFEGLESVSHLMPRE